MTRVLIGTIVVRDIENPYREALRGAGFELVIPPFDELMNEDGLIRHLDGIDATLAGSERYTRRVIESAPRLKAIARNGVGFDAVDIVAAAERGIPVTVSPANNEAVAEHTFALILAVARQVVMQHDALRRGEWRRIRAQPLRGQTLGIVGLGRIGKTVALRGAAFGMKVIATEPVPNLAFVQQHSIELVPLDRLLAESDFVTLHVPLTDETRRMMNKTTLRRMKPTAFLINTSRGPVVHEADLCEALREKVIAGAGLDVYEREPPGSAPICQLDNVVLTAHTAGVDARSSVDMALMAAQSIVALSRGEWPEAVIVNPAAREKFNWKK
jgi:phosphoglycerate dehydrogenase-like enzyme